MAQEITEADIAGMDRQVGLDEKALMWALVAVPQQVNRGLKNAQTSTADFTSGMNDVREQLRADVIGLPGAEMISKLDRDMMMVMDASKSGNEPVGRFAAALAKYEADAALDKQMRSQVRVGGHSDVMGKGVAKELLTTQPITVAKVAEPVEQKTAVEQKAQAKPKTRSVFNPFH